MTEHAAGPTHSGRASRLPSGRSARVQMRTTAHLPAAPLVLLGFALAGLAVPAHSVAAQAAAAVQLPPAEAQASRGFTRVTSVRELPDGRLLLVDQGENRLRVLDRSLNSVEDIGREGDGPGEYRRVGWLHEWTGPATIFTDQYRHNWHVLDGEEIERTLAPTNPVISEVGVLSFFGATGDRGFLTISGSSWDPSVRVRADASADSLVAILVHADAEWEQVVGVDTFAVLKGQGLEGDCSMGMGTGGGDNVRRTCSPLRSADVPLLFQDAWLAIARVDPYRVEWKTPDGEWIRGPLLDPEPGPAVDARHRCWVVQGWPAGGPTDCDESRVDSQAWPDQVPAFLPQVPAALPGRDVPVVLAAPGGELLIRRAPVLSHPGTRYDLVDRRGVRKATLELSPRQAIVGFGADVVYTVTMGEFDLQWLRRHPWPLE